MPCRVKPTGASDCDQGAASFGQSAAMIPRDPGFSELTRARGSRQVGVARIREVLRRRDLSPRPIEPLLSSAATQAEAIKRLDQVASQAELMTIPGVAHGAGVRDHRARRFAKSREWGPMWGRRGAITGEIRISKHGDALLRSPASPPTPAGWCKAHPLKDWARRIRRRSSHKKACVALARKLAVIMHRMMSPARRSAGRRGRKRRRRRFSKEFNRDIRSYGSAQAEEASPAGTMAKAIPPVWLQAGQMSASARNTLGGRSQRAL